MEETREQVGRQSVKPSDGPVHVDPPPAKTTVLWAVGDGAMGGTDAAAVVSTIARDKPDGFLWLGDVYESGTAAEFQANYKPDWGLFDPICYPVPGNHDWPNYQTGYLPYFAPRNLGIDAQRSWYAASFDGWELLALDSEALTNPGSPQFQFVQSQLQPAQLAANPRKRLVCWHRPRFCSGSHGDATDLDALYQLLAPHCMLLLSGHAHNMQLFQSDATGCRQIVSGAGGRALYAEVPDDPRLQWGASAGYGACRLGLSDSGIDLRFVSEMGQDLYRDQLTV